MDNEENLLFFFSYSNFSQRNLNLKCNPKAATLEFKTGGFWSTVSVIARCRNSFCVNKIIPELSTEHAPIFPSDVVDHGKKSYQRRAKRKYGPGGVA